MGSRLMFFFAGAVVALVSVAATRALDAKPSFQRGSHVMLSPEDYIEIQQLYGMYSRDVDPGSVRDASWMFSPDATAVIAGPKMSKPTEFKDFYQGVKNRQAAGGGVRHFNSSYVIVGTPDGGARGSSYMMQVETRERGGRPEVTLFGKYEDKLVKTKDGWRIKERVWRGDSYRGSNQPVSASPVPGDRSTDRTGIDDPMPPAGGRGAGGSGRGAASGSGSGR
jgi:hypothetical protein